MKDTRDGVHSVFIELLTQLHQKELQLRRL